MKRKLVTLLRIFKSGLTNFVRNAWLAIAAIAVMVVTLTIVLFSVIANATFANTINQITDKTVLVEAKPTAKMKEILQRIFSPH